ncbi:hypothetical protein GH714_044023 [Hevea brasiliensis]|uniref:Uncharacterized protein n=1 Tax=Hevea brasiliensis TaxID=3981 RepID=A0A6A6K130_HEVBR|nr:hypothetical protein GH714_044023 [Hevea brasiliensis]
MGKEVLRRNPKECKRGHTPKLQKGHPPREKVDCAKGNAVARSPRKEASPRQEGPRRHRSRKSRRKCKAEGRAGALSHKDEGGTAGAQQRRPEATLRCMPGGMGGGPNDEGVVRIEWGRMSPHKFGLRRSPILFREVAYRGRFSRCKSLWGEGKCIAGRQCLRESFSGQTGQPGKQESCREEQAKMRLSLPTARQNERGKAGRRARANRFKLGAGAARRAGKRGSPEGSRSAWRALDARGRCAGRARAASPPKRGSPALAARQNEVPRQFLPARQFRILAAQITPTRHEGYK